jgi:hypothetical protein
MNSKLKTSTSAFRASTMHSTRRLVPASIFFAIFWTAGMVWWTGDSGGPHVAMLAIAGTLAATAWFWMMKCFMTRRVLR